MGIKKLQVPQMCGVAMIAVSTRGPSSPPQGTEKLIVAGLVEYEKLYR